MTARFRMIRIVSVLSVLPLLAACTKSSEASIRTGGEHEDKLLNDTYFNPQYYDVMMTDLKYGTIADIAREDLGFEHDAFTTIEPTFPIEGIVTASFASYGRPVGGVILRYKKTSIQSLVVFDSAAPAVYLCDHTLHALGIDHRHTDHANVMVHGQHIGVLRSTGHFKDVNIIGASYFLENKMKLSLNYRTRTVEIRFALPFTEKQEHKFLFYASLIYFSSICIILYFVYNFLCVTKHEPCYLVVDRTAFVV